MSASSDSSDEDEPPRHRPSTLEEYRAGWVGFMRFSSKRFCFQCRMDYFCRALVTRRPIRKFETSDKTRIFASGEWRIVEVYQWDEYLTVHGNKRNFYTWNPGERLGVSRHFVKEEEQEDLRRASGSSSHWSFYSDSPVSQPGSPSAALTESVP
jgi:hypothetical protein